MHAMKSVKQVFTFVAAGALVASATWLTAPASAQPGKEGDRGKNRQAAAIGEAAPDFTLTDLDGKEYTLSELTKEGKTVVLEWFNPNCPYIVKHHDKFKTMDETYAAYKDQNVVWFAINSGAPGKQGAGKEHNKKAAKDFGMKFPLLLDEDGTVGKAYGAKVTPHMFIISADGVLVYKGAIDNDNSAGKLGDINYVRQALDEVLAGETVSNPETRPYGCSVKYGS